MEFHVPPMDGLASPEGMVALLILSGLVTQGLIGLFAKPPALRLPCRWRRAASRHSAFRSWSCTRCRTEAFTRGRRPPQECKRGARPAPL